MLSASKCSREIERRFVSPPKAGATIRATDARTSYVNQLKKKGKANEDQRRNGVERTGNQKGALKVVDALAARRSLPERTPLGIHTGRG